MYDPKGYYEVLEAHPDASDDEIKKNYRRIAKVWHPDQNDSEEALEMFQKISVAYDVFKDEKKRLTYDLLAQIYGEKDFPEMFALKVYSNKKGVEDVTVRALRQEIVIGKFYKYLFKSDVEHCNLNEAKWIVFRASILNWFAGWWTIKGAFLNLKTIINNFRKIGKNNQDNLKLLIHNALAYQQEEKNEQAFLSAAIANSYANVHQKNLLKKFVSELSIKSSAKAVAWNYFPLKLIQLIIPALIFFGVVFYGSPKNINLGEFYQNLFKEKELNYYQEVKYMRGNRGVDDVIVSKVFDIPVDVHDDKFLFHLRGKTKVMFAPGENFDVVGIVGAKTTVRVTGYTPDKVWYRILLDNGQMGFVRAESLKKGVGNAIPDESKVYKPI
ncbi:MAG: DnaJ domain-containing protein [Alphaproteobacteria bacterium]